jgi:hypothetical protein
MLPSTDDEEEELVQTKAHKKHNRLYFSGEVLAGLLLLSVHCVSLGSILIFFSVCTSQVVSLY